MTGEPEFDAAIDDLRALMDALVVSEWKELHVVDGNTEIYISRDGSRGNPMLETTGSEGEGEQRFPSGQMRDVSAPHVCTIATFHCAVGDHVEEGAEVASISVLDDFLPLVAPCAGVIMEFVEQPGDFAEYGTLIMRIAGAAH